MAGRQRITIRREEDVSGGQIDAARKEVNEANRTRRAGWHLTVRPMPGYDVSDTGAVSWPSQVRCYEIWTRGPKKL